MWGGPQIRLCWRGLIWGLHGAGDIRLHGAGTVGMDQACFFVLRAFMALADFPRVTVSAGRTRLRTR